MYSYFFKYLNKMIKLFCKFRIKTELEGFYFSSQTLKLKSET